MKLSLVGISHPVTRPSSCASALRSARRRPQLARELAGGGEASASRRATAPSSTSRRTTARRTGRSRCCGHSAATRSPRSRIGWPTRQRRSISSASPPGSTRSCRARARSSARCARPTRRARPGRCSTASSARRCTPEEGARADGDRREPGLGLVGRRGARAAGLRRPHDRRVLVVGAGKVSELAARSLAARGARSRPSRTVAPNAAPSSRRRFGAQAVPLERGCGRARVAPTSSSAPRARPGFRPAGRESTSASAQGPAAVPDRPRRPARPRPGDQRARRLLPVRHRRSRGGRRQARLFGPAAEAERAEAIVADEAERFRDWQASLEVVPAIASLRARAEEIRTAELAKAEARPD